MGATNVRVLSAALLCIIGASRGMPVEAAPQGGNVVAGQGGIQQPDAITTVVTQSSPSLVIDWNSFNVGSAERVQFKQPDAAAAVLNRIGDARPSEIDGALSANGRVFLINPNGLIFGNNAVVNVGSLVAGSLGIANEDFMRGDYRFSAPPGQEGGRVVNHGLLSAALGGSITLVGGSVANDGLIVANYGQVNLGAGHKALLDFDGDGLLRFEVQDPIHSNGRGVSAAVTNSGSIVTPGGQVLLTASAAKDVFTQVVNNSGVIQAVGVDKRGGVVRLVGTGGAVADSGTLDASSTDGKGGTIDVLGDQVALSDAAQLDVSGATGGGLIRVGGDYRGSNPDIANALLTYVGHRVSLKADAVTQGDGGKIIVWSDNDTNYFGAASARGGALSGDGGTAEVSGKGALTYSGTVDLRAPDGVNGALLLDPTDITISSGAAGASTGTLTLGPTISESGTANASTLTDGDLNTQLGLSSVEVTTSSAGAGSGNLVVDATAAINGLGNDLTLTSVGSGTVTLNGTITNVGSLTLNSAGGAVTGTGSAAGINLLTGVTDFDVSTHQSHGVTYSGFTAVGGSGQLDNLNAGYDDGLDTATVGGVSYNSFATINGATAITNAGAGFNAGTRVSGNGNTYGAGYASVTGGGTLSGVSNYNAATQQSGAVTYSGFSAVGGSGSLSGITNYDVATDSNGALTFSGFTTVNGSGRLDNLNAGYNDGLDTATVGGVSYNSFATINGATAITNAGAGFNAGTRVSGNGNTYGAGYASVTGGGTLSGITNYDVTTGSNGTVSFSGFTAVDGSGRLDNVNAGYDDGLDTATVGGVSYNSFATINGATAITNAGAGFNAGTRVSGNGNTYGAGYASVTGGGTLSGVSNYNAATQQSGAVTYSGFSAVGGSGSLSGITNYDMATGSNGALTFSGFTTVNGSGRLDNLNAGYDDGLDAATVGGVSYNSFATINGATAITNAGAGFNAGTRVSGNGNTYGAGYISVTGAGALSGITNYDVATGSNGAVSFSGFSILNGVGGGTLSGGHVWSIAGVDSGTVDGLTFSNFANVTGTAGADSFVFGASGSLTGSLNGEAGSDTLDLSSFLTARSIILTGSGTDGFVGTEASVAGGFANIDAVTAPTGTVNSLQGENVANTWSITGVNSGSLSAGGNTLGFSHFNMLVGGASDDAFVLTGGSLSGTLDGGAGANSLTGDNVAATWTITGVNSGSVTGVSGGFSNIQALNGGAANDHFVLGVGGAITGRLNGNGGTDTLDYSGFSGPVVVNLDGGATVGVSNVENLVGGSGANTLIGPNESAAWTIDHNNGGTIQYSTLVNFNGFQTLSGGGGGNTFNVAGGSIETINAGADGDRFSVNGTVNSLVGGAGNDTVDVVGGVVNTLNGGGGDNLFTISGGNVLALDGGSGNINSLAVTGGNHTWNVTANNAGNVSGAVTSFSHIQALLGGEGGDVFNVDATGVIATLQGAQTGSGNNAFNIASGGAAGAVVGGNGDDIINVNGTVGQISAGAGNDRVVMGDGGAVTGNVDGAAGIDTLDYHNYSGDVVVDLGQNTATGVDGMMNIEALVGGQGGNTLLGPNAATDWGVLAADTVSVNGAVSALGFHSLQGGSEADRFDIGADFTGSVDGGGGADTVNIIAPIHAGRLDLVADEVNFNTPGQINAGGGAVTITAATVNADQKDVHIIADSLALHATDHAGTYNIPLGLEIRSATDFGAGSRNFVSGVFGATQGDFTDVGKTTLNVYRGQSAVVQDRGRIDPALFIKDFNLFNLIDGGVRLTPDQREE